MKPVTLKNGIDIAVETPEGTKLIMHDVVIHWDLDMFQGPETKSRYNELRLTINAKKVTENEHRNY